MTLLFWENRAIAHLLKNFLVKLSSIPLLLLVRFSVIPLQMPKYNIIAVPPWEFYCNYILKDYRFLDPPIFIFFYPTDDLTHIGTKPLMSNGHLGIFTCLSKEVSVANSK